MGSGRKMTNSWGGTFYFWGDLKPRRISTTLREAEGKGTFWVGEMSSRAVPAAKGPLCEMQVARVREGEV